MPESYGFIKLAYGKVNEYKDTSKMTPKEVVEEFMKHEGVSSADEYFDKSSKNTYAKQRDEVLTGKSRFKSTQSDKASEEPKQSGEQNKKFTKDSLIEFIKQQTNVELKNDKSDSMNSKRNVLYTQISRDNKNTVLSLLNKKGIRADNHIKDYYFITL